jgi:ADP-ribose pyrophosphatase
MGLKLVMLYPSHCTNKALVSNDTKDMLPKGKIRRIKKKDIFKGKIFDFSSITMRAPNGRKFVHQVVTHPGAAVIVPVLSRDKFVMVRQYRSAIDQVMWEFPAGTLNKGEPPLACAKREIVEETGFRAQRWKKLGTFFPAVGISTERMHVFLATKLAGERMALDQDEYLEPRIVTFRRLQAMILNGIILDGKSILAYHYLCQYRKS